MQQLVRNPVAPSGTCQIPRTRLAGPRCRPVPLRASADGAASFNQIEAAQASTAGSDDRPTTSSAAPAPNATGPPSTAVASSSTKPVPSAPSRASIPSPNAAAPLGSSSGLGPGPAAAGEGEQPTTLGGKVKRFFAGNKLDKERLAALGFGAFSAYGVISNINAGILITIAWLTVVRTTGLTPLDGGNWTKFLAVYAGLWIGSNFLRPIRITLALAAAPLFDRAINFVSRRTGLPKVPAFVVMLFFIAIGTTSTLAATIAALGGFPPGCRMPWEAL